MIKIVLVITLLVMFGACDSDEDYSYIDPVIDMLLNGVSEEAKTTEEIHDEESVSAGSIWKCGNCTDLGEAKLVHSESSLVDEDTDPQEVYVQITLMISRLRCVTVTSPQPGAVRKLLGTCEGSSVTLSVLPSHNYTILVYA